MKQDDPNCFGFFAGGQNPSCSSCVANKRCKAILVSHGFAMTASLVDHLVSQLEDVPYRDVDRVSELVKQLKSPPEPLPEGITEILRMQATESELSDLDLT